MVCNAPWPTPGSTPIGFANSSAAFCKLFEPGQLLVACCPDKGSDQSDVLLIVEVRLDGVGDVDVL